MPYLKCDPECDLECTKQECASIERSRISQRAKDSRDPSKTLYCGSGCEREFIYHKACSTKLEQESEVVLDASTDTCTILGCEERTVFIYAKDNAYALRELNGRSAILCPWHYLNETYLIN